MSAATDAAEAILANPLKHVKIVRSLGTVGPNSTERTLVVDTRDQQHYVVSSIANGPEGAGPETLVFKGTSSGRITDWRDLAGGRGMAHMDAIKELDAFGPREPHLRLGEEVVLQQTLEAIPVVFGALARGVDLSPEENQE